jgi:putative ABC transport system permease protein
VQGAAVRRITALGRLKPGVTLEVAQALARATTTYQANPVSVVSDVQVTPFVVVNGMTSAALRVGLAAAALLLLIAVANAANVLLADAVRRDSEMAIRVSLGASWSRLARQMLTETLLMTAVAAVTAVVVSAWSVGALVKAVPYLMSFQALRPIALDWRALSFAAIIATFASIGASWLSLVRATRVDAQTALRGQRSGTLRQARSRNALTVAQIAVTLPLLASAGLLANGLVHLSRVDPGFDPNHLVDVEVQMPTWRYSDDSQAQAALERVRTEASRLPGVVSATISNAIPPSLDNRPVSDLEIADTPLPPSAGIVSFGRVDAAFFSTLRIPIIAGRGFDAQDRPGSQPVAVVSHALADLLAPNGDALRRRFRESKSDPWLTIVGVAGNITTSGVEQSSTRLTFYTPRAQTPAWWYEGLIVRTRPASEKVVPELRALFRRVMPDAPIIGVTTAAEALDNSTARVRFTTDVITAFAGVAFALALVGVYGAFWCAVRQRTREMGVRLALGAAPADVLRLVIGLGARLTLLGLTAGLPIALIATRLLRSLLFGVSSTDPAMLTAVVCLLAMAAMAATWLPARHASRIDPVSVLRAE